MESVDAARRDEDLRKILEEGMSSDRKAPLRAFLHLVLPFVIIAAAVAILVATDELGRWGRAAAASFFSLGKLIIVFGAAPKATFQMTHFELAAMVVFMDAMYGYFLAYNLHWAFRIPGFGPALLRLTTFCRWWLSTRPWMRKWAFTGVMLFVLFPLTGTGAPGGAILGRILGLKARTTLVAILLGSVLGCGLMASFAAPLEPYFEEVQHETWFNALGLLVLGIVVLLLYLIGRRLNRAVRAYETRERQGGTA